MADLAQSKWATWRRKQRLEATTPERFQDLLDRCVAFADPVLDGRAIGRAWSSESPAWVDASGISWLIVVGFSATCAELSALIDTLPAHFVGEGM
jgi:hypothetical protein